MSVIETMIDIPVEHERNVCGQFDSYLKKIERTLHVTIIARDGEIKLIGPEQTIRQAKSVFSNLVELSRRGNAITEQNVDYALSLSFTESDGQILEIDKDIICRTITGKPVKPKTMGQKQYVDAIRKKMIVFGIGPAGTGKTYLAMAMAIQAFKNGEVGRIILTRPAIEAGEKLGFLPGDLQSKIDPYLRPLYDALYQIMGAESLPAQFGEGADRGGASGLHARPDFGQRLYYTGRGPEYHSGSDEDVPDPDRFRLQGDRHGRPDPEGSAQRGDLGAGHGHQGFEADRRHRILLPDQLRRGAPSAGSENCTGLRRF